MKRIVFVSSLACQMSPEKKLSPETINKLNLLMDLVEDSKSLELGSDFSNAIWKNRQCLTVCQKVAQEEVSDDQSVSSIVASIKESTAHWLKYGDEKLMERDIQFLVENKEVIAGRF
ncbi:MAG: hypothetical protein M0P09_00685 [Acholeplasmataceae bacterium]|nr:hypothetical protein [Acholeplasmataceae bacterium]